MEQHVPYLDPCGEACFTNDGHREGKFQKDKSDNYTDSGNVTSFTRHIGHTFY